MRRGTVVAVAVAAAVVFLLGVFLLGVGSGYVLAEIGPWTSGVSAAAAIAPPPLPVRETDTPSTPQPTPVATPSPTVSASPSPTPSPTPAGEADPETAAGRGSDQDPFLMLREVWDLVERDFYGELPDLRTVNYAAIRVLLDSLGDENTIFIEPPSAAIIDEDATGEFEGIGAFVGLDDEGKLEIVRPFANGPAGVAGLLAGDRVLEVDGTLLAGKTLYEAINLIRGPAGTDVRLLIERTGVPAPFEAIVTRARIEIPTITIQLTEEGIGYIRLHTFNAAASEALEDGLAELLQGGLNGVVLDLRQNPGGWLDQAIEVADLFLAEGVIVEERWSDGSEEVFESHRGDIGERVPLVVLVDRGSASASEIVAGALQDHGRAVLIGEQTYGKGSVQRPYSLSDGSELRVTIAVWITPNGRAIHGHGLVPDIEVPWPEETSDPLLDPQLDRAIEYLLTGE